MKFKFRCPECGLEYEIKPGVTLCPACRNASRNDRPPHGVLETIAEGIPVNSPFSNPDEFIKEMLPVEPEYFPPIPVGGTPMWEPDNLREKLGLPGFL